MQIEDSLLATLLGGALLALLLASGAETQRKDQAACLAGQPAQEVEYRQCRIEGAGEGKVDAE